MKFTELNLSRPLAKEILRALEAMAFETPTPIQAQSIPVASEGKDLIAIAETGTGKTGAFALPMTSRLLANREELALVLAPTRELALQIEEFMRKLTQFTRELRTVNLVGGMPMGAQIRALQQKPRILIATPGRLIDHMERGSVNLSRVGVLVLDEADRMLDMGFQPQLERIRKALPTRRQTLLFSATWGREMDQLSSKYLHQAARVGAARESRASANITQKAMTLAQQKKNETLLDELVRREGSVLVFARTQVRVDRVSKYLASYGLEAARIHGGRTQAQRNGALAAFKTGRTRFLIATDIAARGIDVTGIGHVVNYDLPQVAEDYIHRIGRTGRNGLTGESISFVTPEDRGTWREIVRLLQRSGSPLPQMLAAPESVVLPERKPVARPQSYGMAAPSVTGVMSPENTTRRNPGSASMGGEGHERRFGRRRDRRDGGRSDGGRFDSGNRSQGGGRSGGNARNGQYDGRGFAAKRSDGKPPRVRRWGQPPAGGPAKGERLGNGQRGGRF